MCAIIGALVYDLTTSFRLNQANDIMRFIYSASHERGRDGRGFAVQYEGYYQIHFSKDVRRSPEHSVAPADIDMLFFKQMTRSAALIANLRAEPTTEFVLDKSEVDQQPYTSGTWSIVHNGTIANDADLRTFEIPTKIDSAAIAEQLGQNTDFKLAKVNSQLDVFLETINCLKGSYAILGMHAGETDELFVAANYRPIWYITTEVGTFFASAAHYFPPGYAPVMVKPYTVNRFRYQGYSSDCSITSIGLIREQGPRKALVVCSGGLDSVVAATVAKHSLRYDITLLHFRYDSRAEEREVEALEEVADYLGVPWKVLPMHIYDKSDSHLLQADGGIAGGEAGAEFAHEWVPARNLVMLALATAYAEAKGFDTLILGNNLEEAGAYPDNEPEFIHKFNELLPFAVADGKRVRIEMPVGNLMKHEIVALGRAMGAPMHLTWSCYRAGEKHCGTCGPCFMRRTAFMINGLEEVVEYESLQG